MPRLFTAVLMLLTATVLRAELPPELAALQKTIHRVIDTAEPSIACLLVSRSTKYAQFDPVPASATPGKLGGFTPRQRFLDIQGREPNRRLDLANLDTVPESYGSGVVIDPAGLILTAYHVIQEDVTKIYVRLPGGRGSYADIVAFDARADLAVLRMINPPARLTAIKFGDGGRVRKGDFVISLANPFAAGFRDGSPSASSGIVSNVRRKAGPTDESKRAKPLAQYGTQIQADVRLNLGCSGGALLNLDGELIGLTTSLAAVAGGETPGGYAVPLDANIKKLIAVLQRGEEVEYGFLGVNIESNERSDGRGVTITGTPAGLPAARAGLRAGDVIVRINGNSIRDHDDLFLNVGASLAGSDIEIEVRPYGERGTHSVKAKLAKATHGEAILASNRPKPVFGLRVDFSSTLSIDTNPPEGVLIRDIDAGSPADKKLKAWADRAKLIVVSVNGKAVLTPAEFYREAAGKSTVELDIVEAGPDAPTARQKVTLP